MKTNQHFAKLHNRIPEYAPVPLKVVTHHHEEYDVDVLDPETGEPTGETEHIVSDWDTWEKKLFPTSEEYLGMGWLIVVDKAPKAEEGHYVRKTGFADEVDGRIVMEYEQVPLPPVVHTYRRSWLAQWMYANGKWNAFTAFIEDNAYSHLRFLWEICTEFDEDNAQWPTALAAFKAALQLTDAEAEAMLAYGATGGQP